MERKLLKPIYECPCSYSFPHFLFIFFLFLHLFWPHRPGEGVSKEEQTEEGRQEGFQGCLVRHRGAFRSLRRVLPTLQVCEPTYTLINPTYNLSRPLAFQRSTLLQYIAYILDSLVDHHKLPDVSVCVLNAFILRVTSSTA
jgi:hypothetical protein